MAESNQNFQLFWQVLIVAKCNVNENKIIGAMMSIVVLIVAKCNVNVYGRRHGQGKLWSINSSKV